MRLCSGAGCGRAVPDDARFCAECDTERRTLSGDAGKQHVGAGNGTYDALIDRLNQGQRWHRVRKTALQRSPLCKRCELRVSEIVDHIVPAWVAIAQARESGRWPLDQWAGYYLMSNLQGLCRPCHGKKTAEDKAHQGAWPSVVEAEAAAPAKRWTF
jgi:hypothetical protein